MSRPAARAAPGLVTLEGVYSEVVAVHEQLDRIERLLVAGCSTTSMADDRGSIGAGGAVAAGGNRLVPLISHWHAGSWSLAG